jgi:hypothetical protein
MNKQKRISLSTPQSRSSRMRNIQTNANYNNFWAIISLIPSSLVPRGRLDYTQDELTKYIKDNGHDYCNAIMGVSCGDGGPDYGQWEKLSPYWKWYVAGGKCPNIWESRDFTCTKGCSNPIFGCS